VALVTDGEVSKGIEPLLGHVQGDVRYHGKRHPAPHHIVHYRLVFFRKSLVYAVFLLLLELLHLRRNLPGSGGLCFGERRGLNGGA